MKQKINSVEYATKKDKMYFTYLLTDFLVKTSESLNIRHIDALQCMSNSLGMLCACEEKRQNQKIINDIVRIVKDSREHKHKEMISSFN